MSAFFVEMIYNAVTPLAVGGGHVVSLFMPKVREALEGRRGAIKRFRDAGAALSAQPVWFHVSSVGEYEQARPVISALEREHPDIPVALTFSSPSGYGYARRKESIGRDSNIRFIDYLPVDTRGNMKACLAALQPRLLVVVKFDLWPNLIWQTKRSGVPIVFINATLSPSSGRRTPVGRFLYRHVYSRIDRILAISQDDADRFAQSTPGHPHISVVGDTRFDRVMERHRAASGPAFRFRRGDGPVVIAGSTWPPDEAHLLGALGTLMQTDESLQVIVAPHEPTPDHLGALQDWAQAARLSSCTVKGGVPDPAPRVTIIDTVGVLAEAYALADVAYVGGAFSTGVHSVIEPAIAGLPAVFGPKHDNSFEALQLIARSAGFAVDDEAGILTQLQDLLYDEGARAKAGARARAYVESQLGATEKCLAAVQEYI